MRISDWSSDVCSSDLIEFIGTAAEAVSFAEAQGPHEVIDASGKTVMPGLIDVHCHISYGDPTSAEELHIYTPVEYRTIKAVNNAQKEIGRASCRERVCQCG